MTSIRHFLPFLLVPVLGLSLACGGDETDDVTGDCTTNGTAVQILDNHATSGGDHALIVTAADVIAGVEKVYDIRGDNTGHTHSVTLSAADFTMLSAGTAITVTSSNNGAAGMSHTHELTISCR